MLEKMFSDWLIKPKKKKNVCSTYKWEKYLTNVPVVQISGAYVLVMLKQIYIAPDYGNC